MTDLDDYLAIPTKPVLSNTLQYQQAGEPMTLPMQKVCSLSNNVKRLLYQLASDTTSLHDSSNAKAHLREEGVNER